MVSFSCKDSHLDSESEMFNYQNFLAFPPFSTTFSLLKHAKQNVNTTTLAAGGVAGLRANLCLSAHCLAHSGGSANNFFLAISFVKFRSPFL